SRLADRTGGGAATAAAAASGPAAAAATTTATAIELGHLSRARSLRRSVRANPRRLCRGGLRPAADRGGDQRHAEFARPAFELHERQELPRHAGAGARRVRWPR